MRVIKIFLLFVCCISLDVQSQTFLSDTLGINEDGSVIIAKSLALPGWILGVDVDSTDNLLFIRYRNLSKNETSLKNKGGISVYSLADQRMLWQRPVNYFNQDPKLTSEGVLFVTMGKATSLLDLKTGNEVWKKKKMIPYCVDAKNRMFLAYKGSYMNGVSNELEGHSLATGEKMWSRKMSHVYGWNESGLLDDSTRLIVSDGIHLVHMGNGEGPSYAMPTGASDYKEAVALGALGVVTGVLTGFAAVPTGPKKVMELVSNVLSDDTVFYVASRENLFCLDRQLQPKWGYPIPDGMGSRSHLFARGDSLYMINMGTGYRNTIFDTSEAYAHEYLRLKVGWPFIACFDKRKGERSGLLTSPLRARFGINMHLEYYDMETLTKIVLRSANILNVKCELNAAREIASRSRGTPRIANALLRRVRDFAQVKGNGDIDKAIACFSLEALNIDRYGLDQIDNKLLTTIIDKFQGGPVGLTTIATALGEDPGTLEEVYEPFLIKEGFIKRTPRGREVTDLAYTHLGRSRVGEQGSLFD